MNRAKNVRGFAVLVLLGAALGGLFLLGSTWLHPEVSLAPVERGTAVDAVPGVVRVTARYTLDIRSESAGRITESHVEPGTRVEEGDVLFRLDTAEIEWETARVKSELDTERALGEIGSLLRYDLEEAREERNHKRELFEDGEIPRRELDAIERRVARLADEIRRDKIRERQRVRTLEQELERLERDLAKTAVRSPAGGDIVEVQVHPGDVVGPRAPLARLHSAERRIEATVSEEAFAGIRVGQPATVRFLGYGTRLFEGSVSRLLPAADPETQRYTVHLELNMADELLVPGITGEVSIIRDEREGALNIPRRALFGRQVFVLRDGRVELREVDPGFVSLNRVEIRSGLEEGDYVVVENLDRLRDGDRVRVEGR